MKEHIKRHFVETALITVLNIIEYTQFRNGIFVPILGTLSFLSLLILLYKNNRKYISIHTTILIIFTLSLKPQPFFILYVIILIEILTRNGFILHSTLTALAIIILELNTYGLNKHLLTQLALVDIPYIILFLIVGQLINYATNRRNLKRELKILIKSQQNKHFQLIIHDQIATPLTQINAIARHLLESGRKDETSAILEISALATNLENSIRRLLNTDLNEQSVHTYPIGNLIDVLRNKLVICGFRVNVAIPNNLPYCINQNIHDAIMETLCNLLKYASSLHSIHICVKEEEDSLTIVITNHIARFAKGMHSGIGYSSSSQNLKLSGGNYLSAPLGNRQWQTTIITPINNP